MTPVSIPFAGLAPDIRPLRRGGEIGLFDSRASIHFGRAARAAMSKVTSAAEAAVTLVDLINSLEHEARPAHVLVRAFALRALHELPPDLERQTRAADSSVERDAMCLELVASRGIEPSWNDAALSTHHRALRVSGEERGMASLFWQQLRIGDSARPAVSALCVADAAASPEITDKDFVRAFGVESAIALFIAAWPGESLALVAFSRARLPPTISAVFETFGLYARVGWLESPHADASLPGAARAERHALALDGLLSAHETQQTEIQLDLQRRLESATDTAERAAAANRAQLEANNKNLRRAQRAMVNVIEDLRDAHLALESKVKQRTRELEAASSALAESRARADYAVRLSGIGFWYCDLPFDELAWDDRVKEHFFLPPDARVTIQTFYERIVPEDRAPTREAIEASIRNHGVYDVVYRTHHPETAELKWIRAMGGTAYAPDDTPIRFDGVTVDITSQKRDEERMALVALQAEEASRSKDEFLAMLGHELRNPLAPISTAMHLLKLRSGESNQREIDVIDRQVKHITRLVDDLLDVSRIARGKVTLNKDTVEVAAIVAAAIETATPAIEHGRHQLILEVPRRGLVVDVDRDRMTQVLANLLTNAAKYTPPGGRITVRAEHAGRDIVISIEDNGSGIPADLLPHVFELFVQGRQPLDRSQGGLGLGLALVKNLVTMHGGSVSVVSEGAGRGSTFTVTLPAAEARPSAESDELAPSKKGAVHGAQRILIVDDNVDGAEMLAYALGNLGYRTTVAHDGPEALLKAEEIEPHVALLDIGLPVMNGFELAQKLRERWPELKLMAITGYGQETDRQRAHEAGFEVHLTKPVDFERLAALLRTFTARNGAA